MKLFEWLGFTAFIALTNLLFVKAVVGHEEQVLKPRMIQLTDDKHMYWNPEEEEDDNSDDDINYFSPGYYPSR